METVTIYCSQCEHRLGSLPNIWVQIGERHISPVVQIANALDITPDGVIRQGVIGSIIDGCRVQNVACNQCRSILGSECLSSTVNHVLHENQPLLQTSSILLKDLSGRVIKQPTIQRLLNLKNPPPDEARPEDNSEDDDNSSGSSENYSHRQATNEIPRIDFILNELTMQREELKLLDTAGYQIVTSFNQVVQRIDEEARNLKNKMVQMTSDLSHYNTKTKGLGEDILSAQREIKEVQKALQPLTAHSRFGQEPSSIKNAIAEANACWRVEFCDKWGKHQQQLNLLESKLESTRQDLKDSQASFKNDRTTADTALLTSQANTEELVTLKAELEHLRQELALERSYNSSNTNTVFAAREMDILASNITKINHRASQVETLQMEFELLKGRVQRIEAQTPTMQRDPTVNLQRREPHHSQFVGSKRKASSTYVENGTNPGSPSSDVPSTGDNHVSKSPTIHVATSQTPLPTKARTDSSQATLPKLTKSGAIDKRSLKKGSSKLPTTVHQIRANRTKNLP